MKRRDFDEEQAESIAILGGAVYGIIKLRKLYR